MLSAPADSHAPDLRPLHFIGPIEGIWALGSKLLAQPPRIVVIDDHDRLSAGEAVEGTEDGRVLVASGITRTSSSSGEADMNAILQKDVDDSCGTGITANHPAEAMVEHAPRTAVARSLFSLHGFLFTSLTSDPRAALARGRCRRAA
jgi:hypothetical protein